MPGRGKICADPAPLDGALNADIHASGRADLDEYWRGQEFILRNVALGTVRVGGLERVRPKP